MPTNRVRKSRNARPDISSTHWAVLNDLPMPVDHNRWEQLTGPTRDQWLQHRDEILAGWIATKPGSRPSYWWVHDAPRLTAEQSAEYNGALYANDLIQPRERVSGVGTPLHEVSAMMACYDRGLPDSGWDEDIDSDDLPTYESQASYLRRLKLFAPRESRRIKASQYKPETVPPPENSY